MPDLNIHLCYLHLKTGPYAVFHLAGDSFTIWARKLLVIYPSVILLVIIAPNQFRKKKYRFPNRTNKTNLPVIIIPVFQSSAKLENQSTFLLIKPGKKLLTHSTLISRSETDWKNLPYDFKHIVIKHNRSPPQIQKTHVNRHDLHCRATDKNGTNQPCHPYRRL